MNNKANFLETKQKFEKDDEILNIFDMTKMKEYDNKSLSKNLKRQKTLVLDLDETLVHTSFSKLEPCNHVVKVAITSFMLKRGFSIFIFV